MEIESIEGARALMQSTPKVSEVISKAKAKNGDHIMPTIFERENDLKQYGSKKSKEGN
jgi:hypothetical protein